MDKEKLIELRDGIVDGIIDFDDRIQHIMFYNDSLGSETDRALLAIVTLPVAPLAIAYEILRGGVILTHKGVTKIGEIVEEKKALKEEKPKTLIKK